MQRQKKYIPTFFHQIFANDFYNSALYITVFLLYKVETYKLVSFKILWKKIKHSTFVECLTFLPFFFW
jgi:hypothetical protein